MCSKGVTRPGPCMSDVVAALALELGAHLTPAALQNFKHRVPPDFSAAQRARQLEILTEYVISLDFGIAGAPALPADLQV